MANAACMGGGRKKCGNLGRNRRAWVGLPDGAVLVIFTVENF